MTSMHTCLRAADLSLLSSSCASLQHTRSALQICYPAEGTSAGHPKTYMIWMTPRKGRLLYVPEASLNPTHIGAAAAGVS